MNDKVTITLTCRCGEPTRLNLEKIFRVTDKGGFRYVHVKDDFRGDRFKARESVHEIRRLIRERFAQVGGGLSFSSLPNPDVHRETGFDVKWESKKECRIGHYPTQLVVQGANTGETYKIEIGNIKDVQDSGDFRTLTLRKGHFGGNKHTSLRIMDDFDSIRGQLTAKLPHGTAIVFGQRNNMRLQSVMNPQDSPAYMVGVDMGGEDAMVTSVFKSATPTPVPRTAVEANSLIEDMSKMAERMADDIAQTLRIPPHVLLEPQTRNEAILCAENANLHSSICKLKADLEETRMEKDRCLVRAKDEAQIRLNVEREMYDAREQLNMKTQMYKSERQYNQEIRASNEVLGEERDAALKRSAELADKCTALQLERDELANGGELQRLEAKNAALNMAVGHFRAAVDATNNSLKAEQCLAEKLREEGNESRKVISRIRATLTDLDLNALTTSEALGVLLSVKGTLPL